MSPIKVSRNFNKFHVLTNIPWGSLGILMKNFKQNKTYATTIAEFGGTCYNICVGSYLSSYCSLANILLLNFIKNSTLPYRKNSRQRRQNVGCVITSRLIQLIFNYRPGLVRLELTQNICDGRGVPMVSWSGNILKNKRSKDLSKWKTESNS